ncbi:MAG: DUF2911 domain-containing protein [Thermoanaerobaculia bacterium]|nr:DUF2911 domain-containing protein [Thermoanaerobaculia bacterium]
MRKLTLAVCFVLLTLPLAAQIETPQVSQSASVTQTIGTSKITIDYHRPGVKGRQIWGGLVPYDSPWRMGANEATTLTVSDAVKIEGKELPAGKYSFFAIPGKEKWTLIINKDPEQWGAYGYDQAKDALRVEVKPAEAPHTEWMRFTIDPTSPTAANVTMNWEKVAVSMKVDVDVKSIVWKDVDKTLATSYGSAANWALDSGERLDEGLAWIDKSIAISGENVFNLWTKARILHKMGRAKDAVPVMEKALKMAEGKVPADFWAILTGTMQAIRKDAK